MPLSIHLDVGGEVGVDRKASGGVVGDGDAEWKSARDSVVWGKKGDAGSGIDQSRRERRRLVETGLRQSHRSTGKGAHMLNLAWGF